jgi:hypothetical protein
VYALVKSMMSGKRCVFLLLIVTSFTHKNWNTIEYTHLWHLYQMKQQTISTFHVTALVVLPLIAEEWKFLVFYFNYVTCRSWKLIWNK